MAEQGSVGFEFCVSCGEGTLLDYDMCRNQDVLVWELRRAIREGTTIIFGPAPDDCETGE